MSGGSKKDGTKYRCMYRLSYKLDRGIYLDLGLQHLRTNGSYQIGMTDKMLFKKQNVAISDFSIFMQDRDLSYVYPLGELYEKQRNHRRGVVLGY